MKIVYSPRMSANSCETCARRARRFPRDFDTQIIIRNGGIINQNYQRHVAGSRFARTFVKQELLLCYTNAAGLSSFIFLRKKGIENYKILLY